ncbi:MAG: RrF2 family transcriptional regulator, partial [Planctomycetota bacterium]
MLQFSRRVEYALTIIAALHRNGDSGLHSARSLAEQTHIPFDMVTKCLQRMHRCGFCGAVQGKHGGYRLDTDLGTLSLGAFLRAVFEPISVADCL